MTDHVRHGITRGNGYGAMNPNLSNVGRPQNLGIFDETTGNLTEVDAGFLRRFANNKITAYNQSQMRELARHFNDAD